MNNEIIEILKVKDLEIFELKNKLKSLRQATLYHKEYKALAEDGEVWVNTYSQDCDGVDSYGSLVCKTIAEYIESENSFAESVEGKCSWEIVSKENARSEEDGNNCRRCKDDEGYGRIKLCNSCRDDMRS
jgi:hypothetical protein